MMQPTLWTLFLLATTMVFGQTKEVNSEKLSRQAIDQLFTDSLNEKLGISYPIYKAFKCNDKSGQFYIVLTESNDSITPENDTLNYKIKAFNFRNDKTGFTKTWEINDFITRQSCGDGMENSIWFWTRYSTFTDIDSDMLIDPVIVYGTSGINYTGDGRIKILIYHKGQKFAIRHQNGVLDFERNTKVDKGFYALPLKIQEHIKQMMKKMEDHGNAIFPYGWQKAMKAHKLYFDENRK